MTTPSTTTEAIVSVEGLVLEAARSITRDYNEQEDVAQQLREHLATRALPAFDPSKASWSTFARTCLTRKSVDIIRSRQRARRNACNRLTELPPAPDRARDDRVFDLAEQVRRSPDAFFAGLDPAAVAAVLDPSSPGAADVPLSRIYHTRDSMRRRVRKLAERMLD